MQCFISVRSSSWKVVSVQSCLPVRSSSYEIKLCLNPSKLLLFQSGGVAGWCGDLQNKA